MRDRLLRTAVLGAACLLLVGCSGSDDSTDDADPTPGPTTAPSEPDVQRVDVGGYSLEIACQGEGSPTVVLEAGSGGDRYALTSSLDLSGTTRVCSYDRAGIGLSDPRPGDGPTTVGDLADELFLLLDGAGITEPVVLASHSLGGGIVQFFADRHPERVAGMVFIDSVAIPGFAERQGPELDDGTGGSVDMRLTEQEWQRLGGFGSAPTIVLTQNFRGDDGAVPEGGRRALRRTHGELAARSSDSVHVIATESGHMIHQTVPELVVAAITEVVEAVRSGEELAPCDDRFAGLGGTCASPTAEPGSTTPASVAPPSPEGPADARWVFFTEDRQRYASRWFSGGHRIMIPFGCTPAPYYDPDPSCPDGQGFHHGVDVAIPCGVPLLAGRPGRVISPAGLGPAYGVRPLLLRVDGLDVVIGHTTRQFVQVGDRLRQGQRFALVGDSAASDGCHLHFEVRPAGAAYLAAVDPLPLLDLAPAT